MAYYAEPTGNETSGIFEFFKYVNTVSDNLFFPVILLVIFIVTFISTKQYSTSRAWTASSFLVAFLSIPLAIGELISPRWMYMSFVFVAGGVLWLKLEKN